MDVPGYRNQTGTSQTSQNDLRSALEYQIDIVLRLEEERLILLKENKIQKEKIRELTSKCNEVDSKRHVPKAVQETQTLATETSEIETQTDMPMNDLLNESQSQVSAKKKPMNKSELSIIDEASAYVNKYSDLQSSQMSMQSTASKKKTLGKTTARSSKMSEKENLGASMNDFEDKGNSSFAISNLRQEKNILTEELVFLNKELSKLRTENRLFNENLKKSEKEKMELKKNLQTKTDLVDKLKKDVSEMSGVINQDQFKTVRTIEGELRKMAGHNSALITELEKTRAEKTRLEEELQDFKENLDKLAAEVESKFQEESEIEELKKEKSKFESKLKDLESSLKSKQEELSIKEKTLQEMMSENNKLNIDVDYFKNVAMTSKSFAEKAIADVEVYKQMLHQYKRHEA